MASRSHEKPCGQLSTGDPMLVRIRITSAGDHISGAREDPWLASVGLKIGLWMNAVYSPPFRANYTAILRKTGEAPSVHAFFTFVLLNVQPNTVQFQPSALYCIMYVPSDHLAPRRLANIKKGTVRPTPTVPLSAHQAYNDGLFTPMDDFSALSETDFTSISHPFFPNVGARIKKTKFCDQTVKWSVSLHRTNLFSVDPPALSARTLGTSTFRPGIFSSTFLRADATQSGTMFIFWTNGGPGCSSAMGLRLFMELGPCRIADGGNSTTYFPESWNTNANVFFIDQPVGVGFSYAEFGEQVGTSEDAAEDIAAFMAIFFGNFTKFRGRRFRMAGESYGGRYIPLFGSAVYSQNAELDQPHLRIDWQRFHRATLNAAILLRHAMSVHHGYCIPRCAKWLKESCEDIFDTVNCEAATRFCESELSDTFFSTGKNPYDISKDCEGDFSDTSCYHITKNISAYLNAPSIRALFGVDHSLDSLPFSSCSVPVGTSFTLSYDQLHMSHLHVAALLERGIRVLVYVGTYDWMCNWIGNERWTLKLEWSGHREFAAEGLQEWLVDNERAGLTRGQGKLVYATVEGAGHMMPYDKPKEALALVNRWLEGVEL